MSGPIVANTFTYCPPAAPLLCWSNIFALSLLPTFFSVPTLECHVLPLHPFPPFSSPRLLPHAVQVAVMSLVYRPLPAILRPLPSSYVPTTPRNHLSMTLEFRESCSFTGSDHWGLFLLILLNIFFSSPPPPSFTPFRNSLSFAPPVAFPIPMSLWVHVGPFLPLFLSVTPGIDQFQRDLDGTPARLLPIHPFSEFSPFFHSLLVQKAAVSALTRNSTMDNLYSAAQ